MLPPPRCSRGALRAVAVVRESVLIRLRVPTIFVRDTARNPAMPHAAFIAAAPADPTAFHPPPTAAKRRGNPNLALDRYQTHLPPAFAAHLCGQPPELTPPPRPRDGITAAEDRAMRHSVAASLAPWHAAIAEARAAHRAARIAARSTQ